MLTEKIAGLRREVEVDLIPRKRLLEGGCRTSYWHGGKRQRNNVPEPLLLWRGSKFEQNETRIRKHTSRSLDDGFT